MVRVLFVWPNLYREVAFNHGIASLSAVLREAGHETALINVNEKLGPIPTDDQLLLRVNAEKPALIAFPADTQQFPYAAEMAAKMRRAFPHVPILVGGAYATIAPRLALETGVFDYACVGEGEQALVELVRAVESGRETAEISNIWARTSGTIRANAVRPFAPLDRLPPADYRVFEVERMLEANSGRMGITVSRGCPAGAVGCFDNSVLALYRSDTGLGAKELKYFRHQPTDRVIDEVKFLAETYRGIKTFVFDDGVLTFSKRFVKDLARKYKAATDIPFACNSHPGFFDADTARVLADGGCADVSFAVGSGSSRVRTELLCHSIGDADIAAAFAAAAGAGLRTSASVLFGAPGETPTDLGATVRFLAKLAPGRFSWAPFVPYPTGVSDLERLRARPAASCEPILDFGGEQNLKVRKLLCACPWYVNALSADTQVRRLYSRLTGVIDNLDDKAFDEFRTGMARFDDLMHQVLAKAGRPHYSMRYNDASAVTSA